MDSDKLNKYIATYVTDFKDTICKELSSTNSNGELVKQLIINYKPLIILEEDFQKKKRIKNTVPFNEKCQAKSSSKLQCSRRKKKGFNYCGTHNKSQPHGIINIDAMVLSDSTISGATDFKTKEIEVWMENINGIMYWINEGNVTQQIGDDGVVKDVCIGMIYNADDIVNSIENPRIINHYERIGDEISIKALTN